MGGAIQLRDARPLASELGGTFKRRTVPPRENSLAKGLRKW